MSAHHVRAAAFGLGLATAVALVSVGAAQPPGSGPPRDLPDPTKASDKLKRVLTPPKLAAPAQSGQAVVEKKVELKLRGRVIAKDRALAVIEIGGQSFVLPIGGESNGVKVLEITIVGVTVEVGAAKDVIVLH